MHYIVGQKVMQDQFIIHNIENTSDGFKVWIENFGKEVMAWKFFNFTMPVSIEYNIEF
jgi:hypothetical protein